MWLVVGLGNPGADYQSTRHNIGFMAIDALAGDASFSKKFQGEIAQIERGGEKVLLLKPQTFMNNSGRSVQAAMAFYKLTPDRIIVIHDELDLPLGKLRIKQGGGANGHNGLKDIDAAIGENYWRIRLGIEHPGDKDAVHGHVLSKFSKEERAIAENLLSVLAQQFALFWQHSPEGLMSKVVDTLHPREKKPAAETKEA
jgi:PTH1 family peptidyl-tRNA hydrolase